MTTLTISDCGDSTVRVTSSAATAEERWASVHRLAEALDVDRPIGVHGAVATYDAVLVEFDCVATSHDDVRAFVQQVDATAARASSTRPVREFVLPVVYGGEYGPDLGVVASVLGKSEDDVIRMHCATALTMRCFGSPGGAPMLDGPEFGAPIPRRTSPRPSVPAGAAAVAGLQAVVSARPAPGGWQVLGRTPVTLVDATSEPLSPFAPGDTFRFVPIDASEWTDHLGGLDG